MSGDVNHAWLKLIDNLVNFGQMVSPRAQKTYELLGHQTIVPMTNPVVTVVQRKLGYKFMAAEAAWIVSGDNRVSSIAPYSKHISNFSDDGLTFNGAYGPKFVDQLSYIVRCLNKDPDTRQAVATLWRERPGPTKDVPCTVALQWLVRRGKLHCVTTMRSSDAWLGWVYDVHAFSMMTAMVLLSLRSYNPIETAWKETELGDLYLTAGSQHLYERDLVAALKCLKDRTAAEPPWSPEEIVLVGHPDELVKLLWTRAGRA